VLPVRCLRVRRESDQEISGHAWKSLVWPGIGFAIATQSLARTCSLRPKTAQFVASALVPARAFHQARYRGIISLAEVAAALAYRSI
jgi:hypothetical protein